MEKTVINWESKENHLLLNPRLPVEQRTQVETVWKNINSQFENHIGLLTSGSSGAAKLVLLSKKALLVAAGGANSHLVSGRSDTWLKTLPHFHVGGLSIYARAHLSGARVVEHTDWNTESVYNLTVQEKATLISLVPAQLFDFVSKQMSAPKQLRAAIIGGGALQPDLYKKALALSWPVLPSYGLTECGSQVATAQNDSYQRSDSKLILLPHIEAKLSSENKLMIKSEALLTAYVDLNSGKVVDPKVGGWFTTEDIAEIKGEELVMKGRSQDFLKIGGESVDFASLEKNFAEIFQTSQLAGDAALLPLPDARLGAVIALATSGMAAGDVIKLVERFNEKVMPYERIRHTKDLKKLPRSELGKLLRAVAISEYLS